MDVFLEDVEIVPLLEEVRALIVPLAEKNGNTLELRPAEEPRQHAYRPHQAQAKPAQHSQQRQQVHRRTAG